MISISALKDAISEHAAIRRIRRLQPAGGAGDKLFPPCERHACGLDITDGRGIPLYVLIDEYDNFANTILAHRGAEASPVVHPRRRLLPQLLRHAQA